MSTITFYIAWRYDSLFYRRGRKLLSRCLDTDEDCKFHLDTVQDQKSMRDDPVFKQVIRYVDIELLTRERLISAQKEELVLTSF
jgi:hypothetical protein